MYTEEIIVIDDVKKFNAYHDVKTLHPLITFIDFSKSKPRKKVWIRWELYTILLKDSYCGEIQYGRSKYDYDNGTLLFFAPGQVLKVDDPGLEFQPFGFGLHFHPDLIRGTSLGRNIKNYTFFSYEVNEALHFSEDERKEIFDCIYKIQSELNKPIDKHTKKLIVTYLELFLDYCTRFYDRQFILREPINTGIIAKFDQALENYYTTDKPLKFGIPTVSYFASALNISPNYFGEIVKRETGQSAIDYIHNKTIALAKTKLIEEEKTIGQISFDLGFKNQPHFTRLFKQKTGMTPNEFKNLN